MPDTVLGTGDTAVNKTNALSQVYITNPQEAEKEMGSVGESSGLSLPAPNAQ